MRQETNYLLNLKSWNWSQKKNITQKKKHITLEIHYFSSPKKHVTSPHFLSPSLISHLQPRWTLDAGWAAHWNQLPVGFSASRDVCFFFLVEFLLGVWLVFFEVFCFANLQFFWQKRCFCWFVFSFFAPSWLLETWLSSKTTCFLLIGARWKFDQTRSSWSLKQKAMDVCELRVMSPKNWEWPGWSKTI